MHEHDADTLAFLKKIGQIVDTPQAKPETKKTEE